MLKFSTALIVSFFLVFMLCFLVSSPIVTWTSDAVTVEVKNPGNVTRDGAKYHLTQTTFFPPSCQSLRGFSTFSNTILSAFWCCSVSAGCCWMLVLSASPELLCSFQTLIFYWHKLHPSLSRQKTDLRWLNVSWRINFPTKYSADWVCLCWDVRNNRLNKCHQRLEIDFKTLIF